MDKVFAHAETICRIKSEYQLRNVSRETPGVLQPLGALPFLDDFGGPIAFDSTFVRFETSRFFDQLHFRIFPYLPVFLFWVSCPDSRV